MNCCRTCGGFFNLNSINSGIGVTGPQGPQGPAGTPAISVAAEFVAPAATNEDVVLTTFNLYPASETDITLDTTNNNVVLSAGTYLVSYGTNATLADVIKSPAIASISLTINGMENGMTTRIESDTGSMSGEILITVINGTTIGLSTLNSENLTYSNTYLIIKKLA